MKSHPFSMLFGICLAFSFGQQSAHGDFPDLLRQIPYTANKVSMINVANYHANASETVKQAVAQQLDASEALPLIAPWNPLKIVTAAEVDIQHMAPSWEMVAIEFEQEPDLEKLAMSGNGVVEKLMDQDVAWLQNAGVMKTGAKQLTIVSPLNRQSAARWLRRVQNQRSMDLSPFLKSAIESAMNSGEIVQILDLSNVFESTSVRSVVAASPLLNKIDPEPTSLLCSVRGVTVVSNVKDNSQSSISLDFGGPTGSLAPIAKDFMIGALTKAGAMLNEFEDWKFSAIEKSLIMTGVFTPQGIARIVGLSSLSPLQAHHQVADADTNSETPVEPPVQDPAQLPETRQADADNSQMLRATRNYFRRIQSSLTDIGRGQNLDRLDRSALWINNKVKAIEGMTTRNVDPEMIEYSQRVIEGLSNIVYQYHHSEIRTDERLAATGRLGRTRITAVPMQGRWGRGGVNYGGRRIYNYAPMVSQDLHLGGGPAEKQAIRDREGFDAGMNARKMMEQIQQETAAIEKRMVEKYGEAWR